MRLIAIFATVEWLNVLFDGRFLNLFYKGLQ